MRRIVMAAWLVLALLLGALAPVAADVPYVMHDWENRDWATERPAWGPVGSWMYWGWDQLYSSLAPVESYLQTAAALDKPVALSMMLIEGLGADSTPLQVYKEIGLAHGWDTVPAGYTYPAWNHAGWDAAYKAQVLRLGAAYNGDPRVASVWICTGLYGETVTTVTVGGVKYDISGHNFSKFVRFAVDCYVEAFPDTPLYLICTGAADRFALAEYAAQRGVGIKLNALAPDLPNHHGLKTVAGLADLYHAFGGAVSFGYEHFYPATPTQTYWAMLYGATHGMRVLDLPVAHLDALAATYSLRGPLWPEVERWNEGRGALWVPRNTEYTCAERDWECGEEAAWARGAAVTGSENLALLGRNSAAWLASPAAVRDSLYAAYGVGKLDGSLTLSLIAPGPSRGWAIVYGAFTVTSGNSEFRTTGGEWQLFGFPLADDGSVSIVGQGYIHAVGADPEAATSPTPTLAPSATPTPQPADNRAGALICYGLLLAAILAAGLYLATKFI